MYFCDGSYQPLDVKCLSVSHVIITQSILGELQEYYKKQQEDIARRLKAIEEDKMPFGYSGLDYGTYYPCTFMEVLDKETGKIRFYETSIKAIHEDYVTKLVIDGFE